MTLYDTKFWDNIDSSRTELMGSSYYDHEYDVTHEFPEKDRMKFKDAYSYYYTTLHEFISLANNFDEINLIKTQIQHSQDFALQNPQFETDFILCFCYKNWIIRINIISEQLFKLVNHIYGLKMFSNQTVDTIFLNQRVISDKPLYFGLCNLFDFLHVKLIGNINTKTLKRSRNDIIHKSEFNHKLISDLSCKLFEFKYLSKDEVDPEDIYLEEGQVSEKIKHEINSFTAEFTKKFDVIYSLFANEYSKKFKEIMEACSKSGH